MGRSFSVVVVLLMTSVSCARREDTPGGASRGATVLGCPCAAGSVCIQGQCQLVCHADRDCSDGSVCASGVCRNAALAPPSITFVDGTGTDGGRGRHLQSQLLVEGESLQDVAFHLTTKAGVELTLESCMQGDTVATLALPESAQAGEYRLSAVNRAGSCEVGLMLLRGEPGPSTATDISGADILSRLNETLASADAPFLAGTIAGAVATVRVLADAALTANRARIMWNNDVALAAPAAGSGFLLVVADAETTTIRPQVSAFYSVDHTSTLVEILAALSADDLVLIASVGDVTAMFATDELETQLFAGGASERITKLAPDQGYALIGKVGSGFGKGWEQVSPPGSSGLARLSSVLVDGALLNQRTELAAGAVTSLQIQDGAIQAGDIAPQAVGARHIAPFAVGAEQIQAQAVRSEHLAFPLIHGGLQLLDGQIGLGAAPATGFALDATGKIRAKGGFAFADGKVQTQAAQDFFGKLTNNKWCRGNGTAVVCDQEDPRPTGIWRLVAQKNVTGAGSIEFSGLNGNQVQAFQVLFFGKSDVVSYRGSNGALQISLDRTAPLPLCKQDVQSVHLSASYTVASPKGADRVGVGSGFVSNGSCEAGFVWANSTSMITTIGLKSAGKLTGRALLMALE